MYSILDSHSEGVYKYMKDWSIIAGMTQQNINDLPLWSTDIAVERLKKGFKSCFEGLF